MFAFWILTLTASLAAQAPASSASAPRPPAPPGAPRIVALETFSVRITERQVEGVRPGLTCFKADVIDPRQTTDVVVGKAILCAAKDRMAGFDDLQIQSRASVQGPVLGVDADGTKRVTVTLPVTKLPDRK